MKYERKIIHISNYELRTTNFQINLAEILNETSIYLSTASADRIEYSETF